MACEDTAAGLRACGGGAAGRARASWRGEGRSGTLREACRSCHRVDNSDGVKDKEQLDYVRLGLSCWLGQLLKENPKFILAEKKRLEISS
jgi:hypothetical protein